MPRLLSNKEATHHFKTSDIDKLYKEIEKQNGHCCSPEELNNILENHRELLKSLDIDVLDDYRVIMYFLNGIGIDHHYAETWELFFVPPKYSWEEGS